MKLLQKTGTEQISFSEIMTKEYCCQQFTNAAKAGAFRFFRNGSKDVRVYLATPVGANSPAAWIEYCPFCAEDIE